MVVGTHRIDLIKNKIQKTEYIFTKPVVFAKFVKYNEREVLISIDTDLNFLIIDAMKLKHESS